MPALPPVRPIPPSPGGQPDPANIVGRDDDVERIWAAVRSGTNDFLISQPRRIGKTRTLSLVGARCPTGWAAVYRSFQGIDRTEVMVETILNDIARHERLPRRARKAATGFLSRVEATYEGVGLRLAPPFRDDPVAALDDSLAAVDKALGKGHLLMICDEVPDMIAGIIDTEGPNPARRALGLWRARRDRPTSRVRWLLTGSVGFHHVLRLLQQGDLLNDVQPIPLDPIDGPWTRWLAEAVLLGAGVQEPSAEVIDELAGISGGFAVIIHLVGGRIRDERQHQVAAGEVTELLDRAFTDLDASQQFTSFLTRLQPYYGPDEQRAYWALDQLADSTADRAALLTRAKKTKHRFEDEEHVRRLLDWLVADHYLEHDDSRPSRHYRWRYEPLRRLWTLRRR